MSGKKPLPDSHLKLIGSHAANRRNSRQSVDYIVCLPDPPAWLSAEAMEHYKGIGAMLVEAKIMGEPFGMALAMLSESLALWRKASDAVAELDDIEVTNTRKVTTLHPAFKLEHRCAEMAMKWLKEFGMTPASLRGVRSMADTNADTGATFPSLRIGGVAVRSRQG